MSKDIRRPLESGYLYIHYSSLFPPEIGFYNPDLDIRQDWYWAKMFNDSAAVDQAYAELKALADQHRDRGQA